MTLACVFGCEGLVVTEEEAAFFRDVQPWGFILFGRNIASPDQVRSLVASLREAADQPATPFMIDQEGGRVRRLRPPFWPSYPPARAYLGDGRDLDAARDLAKLGGRLIAHDLARLGVNVNCSPVVDVPAPDGHEVIGDRAFGSTPEEIAPLARAMAEGLLAGGVLPVLKHMPGHGRARVDSHAALPVVEASRDDLSAVDLRPFKALSDMPSAMTAHVVYSAIDPHHPCTTSSTVISQLIRGAIGFEGLLFSDDLSMAALAGGLGERTVAALRAGCDIALHCNADMGEMRAVAENAWALAGRSEERAQSALARVERSATPWEDREAAEALGVFQAALTRGGAGE